MSGFLYYLPRRGPGTDLAALRTLGLGYAFEGPVTATGCQRGPDGGSGVVVANPAAITGGQVGYYADRQVWRKTVLGLRSSVLGAEDQRPKTKDPPCWVGHYAESPPTPADLGRPKMLTGHLVELLDGNRWLVPLARGWTEEDGEIRWYQAMPRVSTLGDDGQWVPGPVQKKFAPLWDLAMRWYEAERGAADGKTFDFSGIHDAAVEALQANYRLGPAEAALLGLLTPQKAREVLDVLIDRPTLLEWVQAHNEQKKTADPAGSNTAAGSADSTAATAPPSPT